jgi:hypothetical protein
MGVETGTGTFKVASWSTTVEARATSRLLRFVPCPPWAHHVDFRVLFSIGYVAIVARMTTRAQDNSAGPDEIV